MNTTEEDKPQRTRKKKVLWTETVAKKTSMDAAIVADIIISQWLHGAISPLEGRVLGQIGSKAKRVCRSSSIFISIFCTSSNFPTLAVGFSASNPFGKCYTVIEQHPELWIQDEGGKLRPEWKTECFVKSFIEKKDELKCWWKERNSNIVSLCSVPLTTRLRDWSCWNKLRNVSFFCFRWRHE